MIDPNEIKQLLDKLHDKYNNTDFIEGDPISVPHSFSASQDIEISGFMAATIAWGNRKAIVKSAHRMMEYMDGSPYDFTINASDSELETLSSYVHRTFNGSDFKSFVRALRQFYKNGSSLGSYFCSQYAQCRDMRQVLSQFRTDFFSCDHDPHCHKHLSSIDKGAACKRLNMYLRWMVRKDERGVDFGLWSEIPSSSLYLPLDVHTASMGRALGLLNRKQNDWKAVEQITNSLKELDPNDPVRYDYALFGAGIDGFLKN